MSAVVTESILFHDDVMHCLAARWWTFSWHCQQQSLVECHANVSRCHRIDTLPRWSHSVWQQRAEEYSLTMSASLAEWHCITCQEVWQNQLFHNDIKHCLAAAWWKVLDDASCIVVALSTVNNTITLPCYQNQPQLLAVHIGTFRVATEHKQEILQLSHKEFSWKAKYTLAV